MKHLNHEPTGLHVTYELEDYLGEQDDRERRAKRQELFTNHLLKIGMLMLVSFFGVAGVIMLLIQVISWFQK
jgi:hypothetical protein